MVDARITALEVTVDDLRDEVAQLKDELRRLRRLVVGERGQPTGESDNRSETSSLRSLRSSRISEGSFSVVRSFDENASRSRSGSGEAGTASSNIVEGTDPDRAPSSRSSQGWIEREAICDEIAEFIKRSLGGDHRGASGRDRLKLPSKVWLVFRDYEGIEYRPVRVCRSWAACKDLVKKAGDVGDSIFIGLPSDREARRVASKTGVGWPLGR